MSSTVAEGRNLIPAHEARLSSTHLQIEPGVMRGTLMCSYIHHQSLLMLLSSMRSPHAVFLKFDQLYLFKLAKGLSHHLG